MVSSEIPAALSVLAPSAMAEVVTEESPRDPSAHNQLMGK
jgi:hypothetical protein